MTEADGDKINKEKNAKENSEKTIDELRTEEIVAYSDIPARESWSKKLDFIFSCIGCNVGLGNVWRFPYLCYKNGGGAFLIPYLITLIFAGVPIYFLELSLGQYLSTGGLGVWKICPAFKGVGYGSLITAAWQSCYYVVILAWALYYLASSFTFVLPWSTCTNAWNTKKCASYYGAEYSNTLAFTTSSTTYLRKDENRTSPVKEFWELQVLQISGGLDEPGELRWPLVLTLALSWIVCYFCIWKGIKWTGKVTWFTSMFPYVLLFVLLVRGLTLPGAKQGIIYYLKPNFRKLLESGVWIDAVTQIFYSYALVLGSQIALGSYNKYHNNVLKDALILSVINSGTSLIAGLAIFSIIGFMAQEQSKDISEVAKSGPGLAFVVYPSAVSMLPGSSIWSVLFFLMLFFVGVDSQFCTLEGFVTAVVDEWPRALRKRIEIFVLVICCLFYLVGLSMVTQGGMYVFELLNFYASSGTVLLFLIFFESVAISWGYGADRYCLALEDMLGYHPGIWWKFCWSYATPVICIGTFIYHVVNYTPPTYMDYVYPWWGQAIGWTMTLTSLLPIPSYALYCYFNSKGTFKERIKMICRPDDADEPFRKSNI